MLGYLKRLLSTGAAYQFGDILAKAIALVTIPLYTRYVPRAGYGAASSLLTAVILYATTNLRDFHPSLLRFQSRLLGADRSYGTFTLTMPEGPSGRQNMLDFIENTNA